MDTMMYIIIMEEDGAIYQMETLTEGEYQSVANGLCDIINPVDMTTLNSDGEWEPIEVI